ncbi:MAG: hypothetical protein AB1758_30850, partial [Candidatus Eremiobacterota bacterium]
MVGRWWHLMPWLAHGADPSPLTWDEALGTLAVVAAAFGLFALYGYRAMIRLGRDTASPRQARLWALLGAAFMTAFLGAFVESACRQVSTPAVPQEFHAHYTAYGGQVAMYRNYHIEVTRTPAGEFRVFLSDSYRRPIAAEFFGGGLRPEGSSDPPIPLTPGLNGRYVFARLDREALKVRLFLNLPGKSVQYSFDF